jgi:hypothetical protein
MSDIPANLRWQVIERAGNRCEYCGLAQEGQEATFHVDHVVPRSADGPTTLENLALACVSCSLHKAAQQLSLDPVNQQQVPLFNPRSDRWLEHFRWDGVRVVGLTATGRATVQRLKMNRSLVLGIRAEEASRNRHPPPAPGQGTT